VYQLPSSGLRNWGESSQRAVPTTIDTVCPLCRDKVTFSAPTWNGSTVSGLPFEVTCPGCRGSVTILRLGGMSRENVRIYVDHESPGREPVPGLEIVPDEVISPKLKRAYQSALNVLAIGEVEATATSVRRVVEGITAGVLSDDKDKRLPLAGRIKALAKETDALAKPLMELSDALRAGGNLGAHFDDEAETSFTDASRMLDLLDYLITYLYVVPQQIHHFKVDVLGQNEPVSGAD
jgi:hypothetical protein